MSQDGGDNHFLSAKERDLKPLLAEGSEALELDEKRAWRMEAFLEGAWFAGIRQCHTTLVDQMHRFRADPDCADPRDLPVDPDQLERATEEFEELQQAAASALDLSDPNTVASWKHLLARALAAGARTYEAEVTAAVIERSSDVSAEAQRWLEGNEPAAED